MIVKDEFLPKEIFKKLQDYVATTPFEIVEAGEKSFSVIAAPEWLLPYLEIEGHDLILTFIRRAWKEFDEQPRIHADGFILGKKTELASVLYINDPKGVTPNGTSFFSNIELGDEFPENGSTELFDHLILNEANDESKWKLIETVDAVPNRLLTYESRKFHAKTPSLIEEGIRIVAVAFYSLK